MNNAVVYLTIRKTIIRSSSHSRRIVVGNFRLWHEILFSNVA
jgi:hypothetical protein